MSSEESSPGELAYVILVFGVFGLFAAFAIGEGVEWVLDVLFESVRSDPVLTGGVVASVLLSLYAILYSWLARNWDNEGGDDE